MALRLSEPRPASLAFVVLVAAASLATPAWAMPFFIGLGDLPGSLYGSYARDVSDDGAVVVGWSSPHRPGAASFVWTPEAGMRSFRDFTGVQGQADAVSSDGSTIVGGRTKWTAADGPVDLGDWGGAVGAHGVSADGSTVVGTATQGYQTGVWPAAYRWRAETGMISIGPGVDYQGFYPQIGKDVSADGSTIVGDTRTPRPPYGWGGDEAYRYTPAGGTENLGDLGGDPTLKASHGNAVSGDGSTVVGDATSPRGRDAFRWTAETGMMGLGDFPGGGYATVALDVNGDGSVIIGTANTAQGPVAFRWTERGGLKLLRDVATAYRLDLTGWTLTEAAGISRDGLTIVGSGINPIGEQEAFLLHIPEPSSHLMLSLGFAGLAILRWGRS